MKHILEFKSHFETSAFGKKYATIDFDNTFDVSEVQEAMRYLKMNGYTLFILTYRFDELNQHRYPSNPSNDDMYETLKAYGFSKHDVIFANSELKGHYLKNCRYVHFHIDDSEEELLSIRRYAPHVTPILVKDNELQKFNNW